MSVRRRERAAGVTVLRGARTPGRRHGRTTIFLVMSGLLLSACSSRLSDSEARDQLTAVYSGSGQAGQRLSPGGEVADETGERGADSGESLGAAPSREGTATPGRSGTTGSRGGSTGAGVTTGGSAAAASQGGKGAGGGAGSGAAKAPIVLGMVGNFSGVIGAAFAPSRDGTAAWAKMINAKGGIDGHPVKLLVADDGNNAANDLTIARRFVEEEGAVALVGFSPTPGGAEPVAKYAAKKGIAVVGGVQIEDAWHDYPSMFPTHSKPEFEAFFWAKAMKEAGKKKVAAIYCTEGAPCTDLKNRWQAAAVDLGLEVVWTGAVSLAQPDFTAACSQARSNGAEAMVTIVDGESSKRYARDCQRQNYSHLIVVAQPAENPPATLEGAVSPIGSFPWFIRSGSPALIEYGAAIEKYVSRTNNFTSTGWVAGKLIEKALTGNVSAKPAPQDVLSGLWKLKNETLGGLTQPLTFAKGKNPVPVKCGYEVQVKSGKYVSKTGMKPAYCR